MSDQQKKPENGIQYMPIGMCLGLSIGLAFGSMMGNVSIGMCMGLGIGLCFGSALDAAKRQKKDDTEASPDNDKEENEE